MKKLIAIAIILLMAPASLSAQRDIYHPPKALGYGFIGSETLLTDLAAGFGGEGYIFKGLGLGAEVGGVGLTSDPNAELGVGSADVSYHFFNKKDRGSAAPFVTGGYTAFFGHNTHMGTGLWGHKPLMTSGFNVGGGIDLFASKHWGMRLDVRYHGHGGRILNYTHPEIDQLSFVAFRIGLTFR